MLKNLDIAFPHEYSREEKVSIARQTFSHFFQTILEMLISKRFPIAQDVQIEGGEHLDQALAKGQGCYILAMHMGNWEAMGAAVTKRFGPSYTAVKRVGGDGLNRFVEERRRENGFHWIERTGKGSATRRIFEILAEGHIVGFVMDQARPGEPRLPFFTQTAKTNTSLAAIMQKRPAPIVPAFIVRRRFGSHTFKVFPELVLTQTGDKAADILANSILFNKTVEDCIRLHPEQYFWFHNRWK